MTRVAIFDLDGTLLDSDEALIAPFLRLGITRDEIRFGPVVAEECARLGVSVEDYVAAYDTNLTQPFDGVEELLGRIERWAVCSNKHPTSGQAELDRLGWKPEVALFTDAFDGPKRLEPVLDALGLFAFEAVFVGDTDHDRRAAADAGVTFGLAGWNPRVTSTDGTLVLHRPDEVLDLLSECLR